MNRKIIVVIERRTSPQAAEAWEMEVGFDYDPSSLTYADAIEIRPQIDFAIRQLRTTGDYLDAWIKEHMQQLARERERNG